VYDKRNPFETDTHLPMLIRGPGIAPGTATAAPVAMTDLSATFLRMAGLPIPQEFDGASMLEYVQAAPPAPRLATFIEYVGEAADGGPPALCPLTHGNAAVYCNPTNNYTEPPYWYGRDVCLCQDSLNNTYSCLRVVSGADAVAERAQMLSPTGLPHAPPAALDYRYCEFSDRVGTKEFFNLTEDPYELVNMVDTMDAGLRAALAQRLAALRACKGSAACLPLLTDPIQ
jgi:N-acetylglucosamine-6-sulfatase